MIGRGIAWALALSGAAYAQTPTAPPGQQAPRLQAETDRVAYDAAFFAQFNPQNALEMVQQTPGFALNGGDDRRGFSGAVGNVLIDGTRPSVKSQSLSDILSRIPADQVVRIELLRGAAVAGDASGQAALLNLVRTPIAGGGVWALGAEYGSRPVIAPRGEASFNGRSGQVEYGVGVSLYSEARQRSEHRDIRDAGGVLLRNVDITAPNRFAEGALTAEGAAPLFGGRASATAQLSGLDTGTRRDFLSTAPGGALLSSLNTDFQDEQRGFELGLSYERELGPWSLALVGLIDRARYESNEIASERDALGALADLITQDLRRDSGETILRGALSRTLGPHRVELGAEGAVNTLEQAFALTEDTGAGAAPVLIPNANVSVEEERAELFAAHAWRISPLWSLETRLAWETSTLSFSGDADQSVDLSFWKPSVQITRSFGEANQLRARIYRDVGQLDFEDFVSAVSIADNLINGGNPGLQPETAWIAELGADLRLPGGAALALTLAHGRYSDVNDLVLLTAPGASPGDPPILFDAPGNIGDGEVTELSVNLTAPLDFLLPGARLTLTGELSESDVTDPVTGLHRIVSDRDEVEYEIEFRHDINSLRAAWGVRVAQEGEEFSFRFDEIEGDEWGVWLEAFAEVTLPNDMRLRLTLENVANQENDGERQFFTPDRNGARDNRDVRESRYENAPWVEVRLSGAF